MLKSSNLFFLGCPEVTHAESSYCPSTSFQPTSHPHSPQGAWSHYCHHREQYCSHPIYSCGNHQWSAGECMTHLLSVYVCVFLDGYWRPGLVSLFQGHASNLHHLMPANIQIIRSGAPALQIGTPAVPPQTFTSHLPRGMHDFILEICKGCLVILKTVLCLQLIPDGASVLIYVILLPCRGCCSCCNVQLQNGPTTSHWTKCRPWPASAAHYPSDHSGIVDLYLLGCRYCFMHLETLRVTMSSRCVHSPVLL